MSKHTPGPWAVGEHRGVWAGPVISAAGGKKGVAFVCGESDANARLIAAAPELLAELKNMVSIWEDAIGYERAYMPMADAARSIINKAEGSGKG